MDVHARQSVSLGDPTRLEIVARLPRSTPHAWTEEGLLLSSLDTVYLVPDLTRPRPVVLARIPWTLRQQAARLRLVDRALKYSILQVHRAHDGRLLIANGTSWWCWDSADRVSRKVPRFSATRPMDRGICGSPAGLTYVAEYVPNRERAQAIHIYRTADLLHFETVWEFPPGEIRHIHALVADPERRERIWVLTGDRDGESRIMYTDDEFATLLCFLAEGQVSRATDVLIRDGRVVWGMDAPSRPAQLMLAPADEPGARRAIRPLPGPAYYLSSNTAGAVYVGTTAERGATGGDRQHGYILGAKPDGSWEEIVQRRHDVFPQHGIFRFPKGVLPGAFVVFSQRALVPHEGYTTIARDTSWM
jgi:hypothetical protein